MQIALAQGMSLAACISSAGWPQHCVVPELGFALGDGLRLGAEAEGRLDSILCQHCAVAALAALPGRAWVPAAAMGCCTPPLRSGCGLPHPNMGLQLWSICAHPEISQRLSSAVRNAALAVQPHLASLGAQRPGHLVGWRRQSRAVPGILQAGSTVRRQRAADNWLQTLQHAGRLPDRPGLACRLQHGRGCGLLALWVTAQVRRGRVLQRQRAALRASGAVASRSCSPQRAVCMGPACVIMSMQPIKPDCGCCLG